MENAIFTNSLINEETSILSQLPKKDFDTLIESKLSQLGNFEPFKLSKTCQLEGEDYELETKWKLNELNRADSPSNLFKVNDSRLKSWENSNTMNLFDGKVMELSELTKYNRFENLDNNEIIQEEENRSEDLHLNSSILNESSLITNEAEYRINYLSWDEYLNIKQNLRVSDNKFKKLKLIYDELNLDYIESNEINVINISEEELVKELLALLQLNPNYLFEFNIEQNYFELNMESDIQFDQSTQESLDLFSMKFLVFSTNWTRLDLVTKTIMELPEIYGQLGLCFSQCLSNYLQLIQFNIIKLSEINNLKPVQLSQEITEMTDILTSLTKLCYCQVNLNLEEIEDNQIRAELVQFGFYLPKKGNLISYLYELITLNYNSTPTLLDFILISIFLELCKIWFNWINEVLNFNQTGSGGNNGNLDYIQDPYNEFFIQFNNNNGSDDESGIINQNIIFMKEFGFIQEENIPKVHFFNKGIPKFFTFKLGESVLSGAKCLQLLKMLNTKGDSEYNLNDQLKFFSIKLDIWSTYTMESDTNTNIDYFDRIRNNMGLIRENGIFNLITQFPSTYETSFLTTLDELIIRADNISKTTLFFDSLPSIVYKSLYCPIDKLTQKIEALTMKQILKDKNFKNHTKLVEAIFLYQEGTQLTLFIKETLEYFRNSNNLTNLNNLALQKQINIKFRNYFESFYNFSNLIDLKVNFVNSTNRALQFNLNYTLPFPVDQLISQSTLANYHKIFYFLTDLIQFEFSLTKLYIYSKQLITSHPEINSFLLILAKLLQFCKYWMFTSNQILVRDQWLKFKAKLECEDGDDEVTVSQFILDHSNLIENLLESILLEKSFSTLKTSLYTIIFEVINFEFKLNDNNLNIDDFLEFSKLLEFYFSELDKIIRVKCFSGDFEINLDEFIILKGLV